MTSFHVCQPAYRPGGIYLEDRAATWFESMYTRVSDWLGFERRCLADMRLQIFTSVYSLDRLDA